MPFDNDGKSWKSSMRVPDQGRDMGTLDYQNQGESKRKQGFIRKLFGPSRKEVWNEFAERFGGRVDHGDILVPCEGVTATFDVALSAESWGAFKNTRIHAPYDNMEGFRFILCRRTISNNLNVALLTRLPQVVTGDDAFDQDFGILSDDPTRAKLLFSDQKLRAVIRDEWNVFVGLKHDRLQPIPPLLPPFLKTVDEAHFATRGVASTPERLSLLFEAFSILLRALAKTAGTD